MATWEWPDSRVTRVVDGDTVDAMVTRDIGFGGTVTFPIRLRLARVNTAAVHTDHGRAARTFVADRVLTHPVDIVTLKPYKYGGPNGTVGEYMAEITLPDGTNLSDALVGAGLASYWDGSGPRPDDG